MKNNQRGFTLIELMIVIAIGLIFLSIIAGAVGGMNSGNHISAGINGFAESRCIEGYKFVMDHNGSARQILDEFGKGVRCSMPGR
jgi:prepilin-type N-terminal cleavage/methylation domain-containing protein